MLDERILERQEALIDCDGGVDAGLEAVSPSRWLAAAAASLLAIGAGSAGAAWAQDGPSVRWDVIGDLSPLPAVRQVPTREQRRIASEAAVLAMAHSGVRRSQAVQALEDARVSDFGYLLPYFDFHEVLADAGGPLLLTAIHLNRSQQTDALRQLDRALAGHPDQSLADLRSAVGILLGRPPSASGDPERELKQATICPAGLCAVVEHKIMLGEIDAAEAQLQAMLRYVFEIEAVIAPTSSRQRRMSPDRIRSALIAEHLGGLGQLSRASELIRREGLLQDCGMLGSDATEPVQQLVEAARWAEAADLMASADRSCLVRLLVRDTTDLFIRAGQGALLFSAIRTALSRPPAEASHTRDLHRLVTVLAGLGLVEETEREIQVQLDLGADPGGPIRGVIAAAAVVAGDRARLDRDWAALDQLTGADTGRIADLVVRLALQADPEGPWRERAIAWLGLGGG